MPFHIIESIDARTMKLFSVCCIYHRHLEEQLKSNGDSYKNDIKLLNKKLEEAEERLKGRYTQWTSFLDGIL